MIKEAKRGKLGGAIKKEPSGIQDINIWKKKARFYEARSCPPDKGSEPLL